MSYYCIAHNADHADYEVCRGVQRKATVEEQLEFKAKLFAENNGTKWQDELKILQGKKKRYIAADGTVCKSESQVRKMNENIKKQVADGLREFEIWELEEGADLNFIDRKPVQAPHVPWLEDSFEGIWLETKNEFEEEQRQIARKAEIESTVVALMQEYVKLTNYQK